MYDLIIRNALVAAPSGDTRAADIACKDGIIERIDAHITSASKETIDAAGHLTLPGVIDPQVHFRDPGAPQKEDIGSGSRSAVRGGVTTFLEMPNTRPTTTTQDALNAKLKRAAELSPANYGFFIGATPDNLDVINNASPACGIKVFMGSSTGDLLVSEESALNRIFGNGSRLIAVHAENEARINTRTAKIVGTNETLPIEKHSEIRDVTCAVLATELALDLSERYERRLHILHLSTADEAEILRTRKTEMVTSEVIPNHLFLHTDDYAKLGSLVQMNPPIRDKSHNDRLFQALRDGVIDIIATDHAPHTLAEKQAPYPKSPSGMPGVESSLLLMMTARREGKCTLADIQKWMCKGPAVTYGIPNKGEIAEGWDADIAVVDDQNVRVMRNEDMFSRAGWTPYAGRELTGWVQHTVVSGRLAYSNGKVIENCHGKAVTYQPGWE